MFKEQQYLKKATDVTCNNAIMSYCLFSINMLIQTAVFSVLPMICEIQLINIAFLSLSAIFCVALLQSRYQFLCGFLYFSDAKVNFVVVALIIN